MPHTNCLQNEPKAQAKRVATEGQLTPNQDAAARLNDAFSKLMPRQKMTAIVKQSELMERRSKVCPYLLVSAVLATTSNQQLSYGTKNGYDIVDFAGCYNEMANKRGMPICTPQALEYHLKKREFTEVMSMCFAHLTKQAISLNLEAKAVKETIDLFSQLIGRRITDIRAVDGCYFCVSDQLAKYFPASRTAHKEGSQGAAQIGIQAEYSLRHSMFTSIEITGGTAYEPNFVHPLPNSVTLADAAFSAYRIFSRFMDNNAFLVAKGRVNMAAKVIKAYVDGKEVKDIKGKRPLDFRRYDLHQEVELIVEANAEPILMVDNEGNVTGKGHRKVQLRAVRIIEPNRQVTWVLTNLPSEVPAQAVLKLLRLRWAIERAFLDLKSHNNLRGARTRSRNLTRSMVWASLTTALIKSVTIRCAEWLYFGELSVRKCHKIEQLDLEGPAWSVQVITLVFSRALPSVNFLDVLTRIGLHWDTHKSKPSKKNKARTIAHHLSQLTSILQQATAADTYGSTPKLLPFVPYEAPMLKMALS